MCMDVLRSTVQVCLVVEGVAVGRGTQQKSVNLVVSVIEGLILY